MLFMLAVYGLAAAAAPWLVGRLGTRALVVLSLVPAAFVATLTTSRDAREGTPYTAVLPMTMRSGRAAVTSATPVSVISLAASNAPGSNSNSPGPGRERHSGIVGSEEDD
jgi:predicted MFS family arabinose efflux permease